MAESLRMHTRHTAIHTLMPILRPLRLLPLLLLLHLITPPLTPTQALSTIRSGASLPTPYAVTTETFTFTITTKYTPFIVDPNVTYDRIPGDFSDYNGQTVVAFFPSVYSGIPLPRSNRSDYLLDMRIMTIPTNHKDAALTGCTPWEYNSAYEGAFLVMDTSNCFDVRYTNAAQSGAAGIIVIPPTCLDGYCEPLESLVIRQPLNLTVLSVSQFDGSSISNFLIGADPLLQVEMWMQIPSSVEIDPKEKAALIDIMTHSSMSSFAQTPSLDILPYWSLDLFLQDDFDPCRNRIKGIWCEGPNVVLIEMYNHEWRTPRGIPSSFSKLTLLRYLSIPNNAFTGPIPNEWCELTELRVLKIQEQQVAPYITGLPDCDAYYIQQQAAGKEKVLQIHHTPTENTTTVDNSTSTLSDGGDNSTTTIDSSSSTGDSSGNSTSTDTNTTTIDKGSDGSGSGDGINATIPINKPDSNSTADDGSSGGRNSGSNGTLSICKDKTSCDNSSSSNDTLTTPIQPFYFFWSYLRELTAYRNGLISLPHGFQNCTELRYLRISQNRLQSIPSFALFEKLMHIDLSQNLLTGSLPYLNSLAPLDTISFSNNFFSSDIPPGMFDYRFMLRVLDINTNRLTGEVPNFLQPNRLEYVDVSSQRDLMNSSSIGLSGILPQWNMGLNGVRQLYLQENSLEIDSLFTLNSFSTQLEIIDLSWNKMKNVVVGSKIGGNSTSSDGGSGDNSTTTTTNNTSSGGKGGSTLLSTRQLISSEPSYYTLSDILTSIVGPVTTSVRLSYNQFSGPIGFSDVSLLPSLQKVYMDHNMLTEVWAYSFSLPVLTYLDLSYNNISSVPVLFEKSSPPSTFNRLNLAGNPNLRLNASQMSWMTVSPIKTLTDGASYACSMLGSTTSETMVLFADPQAFEYEYCECQVGTFGRAPLCSSVPVQAKMKPFEMIESTEVGEEFAQIIESSVGGILQNLTQPKLSANATLDYLPPSTSTQSYLQSFSDSMYGGTERLTIGMATSWVVDVSDLWRVNIDAMVERGEVPSEQVMKQIYQTSDPTEIKPEWTPVRVLTIRIHLSQTQFSSSSDLLSIYEGGSDLKGDRVFTLRGNDLKPQTTSSSYTQTQAYQDLYAASLEKITEPCLLEISVFSPIVTVSFSSRSTQGLHFIATYSYDFVCPSGYFYDTMLSAVSSSSSSSSGETTAFSPFLAGSSSLSTRTGKCRSTYIIYRPDSSIRNAVFASSGITLFFITATICVLLWNFNHGVFKAASRSFLLLILVFMELMTLGSMLFAAIPDVSLSAASFSSSSSSSSASTALGNAVCNGRVWLTCLPLAAVLGIILAKNRRMWAIFGATTLQVTIHSDLDLLISVTMMCLAQCVLLSVFSGLGMSVSTLSLGSGSYSDRLVISCSQETGFMSWIVAEVCFIAVMMIGTAYLGFKTRNLPSQYNESQHLQNALIILILYSCIIIPLAIFIQNDPNASILIQGLGLSLLSLILTGIIFGPKLYVVVLDLTFKADLSFNPTLSSTGGMETHTGGTKGTIGTGLGSFKMGSMQTNPNTIGGVSNSNGSKGKESTILQRRNSHSTTNHNTPKLLSNARPTSPSAASRPPGAGIDSQRSNVPMFRTSASMAKVASFDAQQVSPTFTTSVVPQNLSAGHVISSLTLPPSAVMSSSPPSPLVLQQGESLVDAPVTPLPETHPVEVDHIANLAATAEVHA